MASSHKHERSDLHPGRLHSDVCDEDWILERDIETADASTIAAMSEKAWTEQAGALMARSPFYRRLFGEANVDPARVALRDIAALPFTTKSDLKDSQQADPPFGDYLAVDPSQIKRVFQTSGTTGDPCAIALTGRDVSYAWGRIQARTYFTTGVHAHSRVLTTFGAGPFVAGATHRVLENLGACMIPVAPGDTARVLSALRRGLADTTQGTPTFAQYLAGTIAAQGIDARELGVRHIITGGEPGGGIPAIKSTIEDAFDAQVTEVYGLGDITPSLFGECPVGGGLHFSGQGIVWPELIDPDTLEPIQLEPGAVGEPVFTSLGREAMPLVRYRSGDIIEIQAADCPCERTSFRMRCIGRVDDMFIVRGVNVYPSAIQAVVADFRPHVTGRMRVVLPETGVSVDPPVPIEVEAEVDSVAPDLAERINAAIRTRLVFRSDVRFVSSSEFGDASYKTRATVRRPSP
jgi:phenylacetate-CoA ligase